MMKESDADVSNAELYRLLISLRADIKQTEVDHETRLRRLEQAVYIAVGFGLAGAGSGVAGLIAAIS